MTSLVLKYVVKSKTKQHTINNIILYIRDAAQKSEEVQNPSLNNLDCIL